MQPDALLKYAVHLQRECTNELGFLTRQALNEYNQRGQIVPAIENGEPCGYMAFYDGRNGNRPRNDPNTIRIYQIAVQHDARRIYHATGLVSRLLYHAQANRFTAISLRCATDLPANKFWRALGFMRTETTVGGNGRGRLIDHWFIDATNPLRTV